MKFRALAIITALTTVLALPALAIADEKTSTTKPSEKAAKLSDSDMKIIAHLHHVNQEEIDLGKIGQKTATAATSVKNYSTMLEKDHQSLDKDLTAFVKKHGHSSIPAEKPETEAEKQEQKDMTSRIAHLKTLKGPDFDKEFLTMMVTEHDTEVARIDTAINAASDPDFQALLKSVKLVLQRHADQARELQKNPQTSVR